MDAFDAIAGGGARVADVISLVGFLVWAAGLVGLFATGRILSRSATPAVR